MSARIIRGNALALPLADASVDLICTSPPYWSLRAYTDNGQKYDGQLGSEATADRFVDNLIAATAEMKRVLKPTGSAFVNLGDKYGPNKSLMLIPERYRIACTDRLGLIARSVIVWGKPNGLPESVTDRVRRSHEDWVHLTKEPRYYSAVDEIREPTVANMGRRTQIGATKVPATLLATHSANSPARCGRSRPNRYECRPSWVSTTSPPTPPSGLGGSSRAGRRLGCARHAAKGGGLSWLSEWRTSLAIEGPTGTGKTAAT
jgi:SAM-dependent methyltransferase